MKSPQEIIQIFNQNGFKITPQRRLIFEILAEDESHPTVEELYKRVILQMPDVSQTTVYNTLHELVELGELSCVENMNQAGARFDTNTNPHHHLFCIHCHKLIDLEKDFQEVKLSLEETEGYKIVKNQVTFYGICQECQKI